MARGRPGWLGPFHDTETQSYTAEDFRFTTKGNNLFAIELGWPDSSQIVILMLSSSGLSGQHIRTVTMLGSDISLVYQQSADGLHIKLPLKPAGESAYAFRIGLDGPAQPGSNVQMTCHRFAAMKAKINNPRASASQAGTARASRRCRCRREG
jgi:hypothetical protein